MVLDGGAVFALLGTTISGHAGGAAVPVVVTLVVTSVVVVLTLEEDKYVDVDVSDLVGRTIDSVFKNA